jgi:hypothetical protein
VILGTRRTWHDPPLRQNAGLRPSAHSNDGSTCGIHRPPVQRRVGEIPQGSQFRFVHASSHTPKPNLNSFAACRKQGRVRPVLVKRNDDFSWCRRAVPADSGSTRARQSAQNPPCRTMYPGANLAPHLCIAHAHAHFFVPRCAGVGRSESM